MPAVYLQGWSNNTLGTQCSPHLPASLEILKDLIDVAIAVEASRSLVTSNNMSDLTRVSVLEIGCTNATLVTLDLCHTSHTLNVSHMQVDCKFIMRVNLLQIY